MRPLDFRRAAALFVASDEELARALGISADDVRRFRAEPARATGDLLERMGHVLVERGHGMARVGELMLEEAADEE
ncbi:MAG: hypothetical protein ACRELV_12120 [Longimicrobiales bacterium]